MTDYVPLPHCRHRATAALPGPFRRCCHCGAVAETREAYWASGIYDEHDHEPEPEYEEQPA